METIVIFGASGQTGVHLVFQALQRKYKVKAIVRSEEKMKSTLKRKYGLEGHENLENVVCENIFDVSRLSPILDGTNCVVSVLGFENKEKK